MRFRARRTTFEASDDDRNRAPEMHRWTGTLTSLVAAPLLLGAGHFGQAWEIFLVVAHSRSKRDRPYRNRQLCGCAAA